jgi:hypothetical protein
MRIELFRRLRGRGLMEAFANSCLVDGDIVRTRRLPAREAARLMGVSDDYRLPDNYIEAYGLMSTAWRSRWSDIWLGTSWSPSLRL